MPTGSLTALKAHPSRTNGPGNAATATTLALMHLAVAAVLIPALRRTAAQPAATS